MSRLVKYNADQSGPYTSSNNKATFSIRPEKMNTYDLSRSYLYTEISIDTPNDGTPANNGVHNVSFGSNYFNRPYDSSCLIMNSSLDSDKLGNIEYNQDVNFFNQNYKHYKTDFEKRQSESIFEKTSFHDMNDPFYQPAHPWVNWGQAHANGNVPAAYVGSVPVLIPLPDILPGLGSEQQLPYTVANNNLTLSVDFDNKNQLFRETSWTQRPTKRVLCQNKLNVPNNNPGKRTFTSIDDYNSISYSDFQPGDSVIITWQNTRGPDTVMWHAIKVLDAPAVGVSVVNGKLQLTMTADTIDVGDSATNIIIERLGTSFDPANAWKDKYNDAVVMENPVAANPNDLVTGLNYSPGEIPFYVGQAIEIVYYNVPPIAPALIGQTLSTIRRITDIANAPAPGAAAGPITITFDGPPFVIANIDDITEVYVKNANAPVVNYTISKLNLVLFQTDQSNNSKFVSAMKSGMDIEYNKLLCYPLDKPQATFYEKTYNLPPGCESVFIMPKNSFVRSLPYVNNALTTSYLYSLIASDKYLQNYRLYVNFVPTTDRDVGANGSMSRDRFIRVYGNDLTNIDEHLIENEDMKVMPELLMTNSPNPILQVNMKAKPNTNLESQLVYVYVKQPKILKL